MNKKQRFILLSAVLSVLTACGGQSDPNNNVVAPPSPPPAPEPPPTDNIDYSEMVTVPAGEFTMGCLSDDEEMCFQSKPAHDVYLDSYQIDKFKVTYDRYNKCLNDPDGNCTPLFEGSACNAGMEWNANHPVNCVDFQQAQNFCEYEGKRLPTEAEWEKAARGIDGRTFPWGNEPPSCDLTVWNEKLPDQTMGPGCGAGTTQPVGTKPQGASPYGVMGMASNLVEWTQDWFSLDYYANSPYENPKGPETGEYKVLRGSDWLVRTPDGVASNVRYKYSPLGQGYIVGFRCAKDL